MPKIKKYLRARVRTVTSVVFEEVEGVTANDAAMMHPNHREPRSRGTPVPVREQVISDSSTMCNAIYALEKADEAWQERIIRNGGHPF